MTVEPYGSLPSRIAIVTHDLHPYGAQRVTVGLVESLVKDFSVTCEVISLGAGELAIPIRRTTPVHNVGQSWKLPSRELFPIVHAVHARGYRHVILNTVISGIAAPLFRKMGFGIVGLVHEMPTLIVEEGLLQPLANMVRSAHTVVYPHSSVRDQIIAAFPDLPREVTVEYLPQGLIRQNPWRSQVSAVRAAVRESLALPPDCPLVLGVGTGDRRKGFDLFVDSSRILNETFGVECYFVWIGPVDERLRSSLVAQQRLSDPPPRYLRLPGFQEDTARYHIAADVFALTSREDPFPNVVLESMDAGVPVLAFSGSGGGAHLAEMVAGRVVGGRSAEDYAAALVELLENRRFRKQTGAAAQKAIDERYSFKVYAERLLSLLWSARPSTN